MQVKLPIITLICVSTMLNVSNAGDFYQGTERKVAGKEYFPPKPAKLKRKIRYPVLPMTAPTPLPRPADEVSVEERMKKAVQTAAQVLNQTETDDTAPLSAVPSGETAKPPSDLPSERAEDVMVPGLVPYVLAPLGMAGGQWGNEADDGVQFRLSSAKRLMAEGRPSPALHELGQAESGVLTPEEYGEVRALTVAANVMLGVEQADPVGEGPLSLDWQVIEVARTGMLNVTHPYSEKEVIEEFRKWPTPIAAQVTPYLIMGVQEDPKVSYELREFAAELAAKGYIDGSTLELIDGYAAKSNKDLERARGFFAKAEMSSILSVSLRAKLIGLKMDIEAKKKESPEVVTLATDIINARTGGIIVVEAMRLIADHSVGMEKLAALRGLEKMEVGEKKSAVGNEIDNLISAQVKKNVNQTADDIPPAESSEKLEASDEESIAADLLDPVTPESAEDESTNSPLDKINVALQRTDEILSEIENVQD